jgi:outer membrane protein assembly factor BamD
MTELASRPPHPGRPRPGAAIAAVAVFALLFAAACGGSSRSSEVSYAVSAERNYERGVEELEKKQWERAARYFQFVRTRFPYSRYAVLAELGLADAQAGAGNQRAAIEAYSNFLKLNPTHELSRNGYVGYKMAKAYLDMLPGDWWLVPPSYERDQTNAMDAHRHLARFVRQYPDSPYLDQAREMLAAVNLRLARHEWYVARFYWNRDKPMGTVIRLRRLLQYHAGSELDGDALWLLGRAYVDVDMPGRAREAWQQLIEEHPEHDRARAARESLARLPATPAGEPATEPRDG